MRTFVFGAGASVHAGYPLASALWPCLAQWVTNSLPPNHDYGSVVDQITESFTPSRPFEIVLSDINDRIAGTSDRFERVILISLRAQTEYLLRHYFNSICHPADLYHDFAQSILKPTDAVITFNYDASLDREMLRSEKWRPSDGYGFVIDENTSGSSSCKLLKLHGSTNWIWQILGGSHGMRQVEWGSSLGWRPALPTPELAQLGSSLVDPIFRLGTGFVPCMIMPTANKRFYAETSFGRECESFWDSLWDQARRAIRSSDEVTIIGYSVPEFDQRARDLLVKQGNREARISICCRADTERLVRLFYDSGFQLAQPGGDGSFENWVKIASKR